MGQGQSAAEEEAKRSSKRWSVSSTMSSLSSSSGKRKSQSKNAEKDSSELEQADVFDADASHPALQLLRKKPSKHLKAAGRGLTSAAFGVVAALRNPELMDAQMKMLKAVGMQLAKVYGVLLAAMLFLWPVTAAVALASPASILSLFQMAPLWVLNVISNNKADSELLRNVFFAELKTCDAELAERILKAPPGNQNVGYFVEVPLFLVHLWRTNVLM